MVIGKYKTKKGYKFYVSIYLDGKRIFRRGFNSKDEAMKKGLELKENNIDYNKIPTFNELLDSFLENYKKKVKITTYYYNSVTIKNYMKNVIPNIRVDKLKFNHFNNWWNYVKKKNISNSFKNVILKLLITIFEYCEIFYNYKNNEVKKLIPIKDYSIKKDIKSEEKIEKYISYENFKKLISVIDNEYWKLFFLVLYFSGMRRNEILALQVTEIPMKEIYVYQQISVMPKKIYNKNLLSPKSRNSNGKILLPNFVMELLNKHIEINNLKVNDFIFFNKEKTKNVSKTTVLKFLVKYAKKAGLKNADKYHFHMFRHGEATLLDSIGIDDNVVSKVLRHSSSEITKKVYIHETENEFKEVQNVLNSFEKDFK
jgi:integrase